MNLLDKITCSVGFHDWSNLIKEEPRFMFASDESLNPNRLILYTQYFTCMCGEDLQKVIYKSAKEIKGDS